MTTPALQIDPPDCLVWNGRRYNCALGFGGLSTNKFEGDGATPVGRFPLRRVFYRADRIKKPKTQLKVQALRPRDGWCDDPSHQAYNKLISRPFPFSHEHLWREDNIYDLIVEIGYNDMPVISGKGSAIFIHIAWPSYASTKGCIALQKNDLVDLLRACGPETDLIIPRPY